MSSIDVFIQREGLADILVATAAPHQTIAEIFSGGDPAIVVDEGAIVFIEDVAAPLDLDAVVEELLPLVIEEEGARPPLRLHVTHCRHVEVSVRYNGEDARRCFPPSATIGRVHHWAARRAFHLTPRDAAEHVLQLQGSTQRPDRDVHIGTLVDGKKCAVAFDLVPRKRVEG
jgi:hypothetical protein